MIHLHIFIFLRGKHKSRHHSKWCVQLCILAVDRYCFFQLIHIFNADLHFPVFPFQFIGRDVFSVKPVGHLYFHREFLICGSLIIDIFSFRLPGKGAALFCKFLISFNIFNILQLCDIRHLSVSCVFQPLCNCRSLCLSGSIRLHINSFFFIKSVCWRRFSLIQYILRRFLQPLHILFCIDSCSRLSVALVIFIGPDTACPYYDCH